MKELDLNALAADPVLAARVRAGQATTTLTGYIRSADADKVGLSPSQSGGSYVEIPRASIVAAFEDEDSRKVTLIVASDSEVHEINPTDASTVFMLRPPGEGCGVTCQSGDKSQTCCCGVGEKCVSGVGYCECKGAHDPRAGALEPSMFAPWRPIIFAVPAH